MTQAIPGEEALVSVTAHQSKLRSDARTFALGLACLAAGVLIYTVARPLTVLGFPPVAPSVRAALPDAIVALLASAPTFVHTFAFSMMTAAIMGGGQRRLLLVCGVWAAVEIVFELAQSPVLGTWLLQSPVAAIPIPYLREYLGSGTFDVADILAALGGAALAAWSYTLQRR